MSRPAFSSLLFFPLLACADAPPAPSIEVTCNGISDALVFLTDGTTITCSQENDAAGDEDAPEGRPEPGAGGSGGGGGGGEQLGQYTCYAPPTWDGEGAPCPGGTDAECPPPTGPCMTVSCGADKLCFQGVIPLGADLCGSPYFSCVGDWCCGAWPIK